MEPHDVRRGRIAYEAYAVSTGGKTYDGREMPSWGELPEKIRTAWVAAATVIFEDTKLCIAGDLKEANVSPAT